MIKAWKTVEAEKHVLVDTLSAYQGRSKGCPNIENRPEMQLEKQEKESNYRKSSRIRELYRSRGQIILRFSKNRHSRENCAFQAIWDQVLYENHNNIMAGDFEIQETPHKICQRYYWSDVYRNIT